MSDKEILEKTVEAHLVDRCRELGWKCLKIQGAKGYPDRLILADGGRSLFVELKRPVGGRLSPMQRYVFGELRRIGHDVVVAKTKNDVDAAIDSLKGGLQ
jgi:hypothetical protein